MCCLAVMEIHLAMHCQGCETNQGNVFFDALPSSKMTGWKASLNYTNACWIRCLLGTWRSCWSFPPSITTQYVAYHPPFMVLIVFRPRWMMKTCQEPRTSYSRLRPPSKKMVRCRQTIRHRHHALPRSTIHWRREAMKEKYPQTQVWLNFPICT